MNWRTLLCLAILLLCGLQRPVCFAAPLVDHSKIHAESAGDAESFDAADAPTDYDEAPIHTLPNTLSSAQYDAYLGRVQRDLNSLSKKSVSLRDLVLVQHDLSPIVRCAVIFDGTVIIVDNRPLRSTISRLPAIRPLSRQHQTVADLIEQLTLVRQGLLKSGLPALANRDSRAARSVLRSSEFSSIPIAPPTAIQKKMTALGDEIGRLLKELARRFHFHWKSLEEPAAVSAATAQTILTIIGLIAAAALVTLLVIAIVNYIEKRSMNAPSYAPTTGLAINEQEAMLVTRRDYASLIQLAKQNASRGEYRNGYRLIYLATLVLLETAGIIRVDRSKTNWEYLRHIELNGHVAIHGLTAPLTAEFDRIWYGYEEVNADNFDAGITLFEQIQAELNAKTLAAVGGRAKV